MSSHDILAAANIKVARWKAYIAAESLAMDETTGLGRGSSMEHCYAMHDAIDLTMSPCEGRGTFPGLSPYRVLRSSDVLSTLTSIPCITTTSMNSAIIGALAVTSLIGRREHVWWLLRKALQFFVPSFFYKQARDANSISSSSDIRGNNVDIASVPVSTSPLDGSNLHHGDSSYVSANGSGASHMISRSSDAICNSIYHTWYGCRLLIFGTFSIRIGTLFRLGLCGLCLYIYVRHVLPRCEVTVHPVSTCLDCSSSPIGPCKVTDRVLVLTNSHAGTHADNPAHFHPIASIDSAQKDDAAATSSSNPVFDEAHYNGSVLVVDVVRVLRMKAALSPLTQSLSGSATSPSPTAANAGSATATTSGSALEGAGVRWVPDLVISRIPKSSSLRRHSEERTPIPAESSGEVVAGGAVVPPSSSSRDMLSVSYNNVASTLPGSSFREPSSYSLSITSLPEREAPYRSGSRLERDASALSPTTAVEGSGNRVTDVLESSSNTLSSSTMLNETNPYAITVPVMQTALQPLLSRSRGKPVSRVWRIICVTRSPARSTAAPVDEFDPRFAFYLPETIEYLNRIFPNLLLVATDAPSVDGPGVSPIGDYSHGTLLRRGIAIIENLRCDNLYGMLQKREHEGSLLTGAMLTVFHPTQNYDDARGCSVVFFPRLL